MQAYDKHQTLPYQRFPSSNPLTETECGVDRFDRRRLFQSIAKILYRVTGISGIVRHSGNRGRYRVYDVKELDQFNRVRIGNIDNILVFHLELLSGKQGCRVTHVGADDHRNRLTRKSCRIHMHRRKRLLSHKAIEQNLSRIRTVVAQAAGLGDRLSEGQVGFFEIETAADAGGAECKISAALMIDRDRIIRRHIDILRRILQQRIVGDGCRLAAALQRHIRFDIVGRQAACGGNDIENALTGRADRDALRIVDVTEHGHLAGAAGRCRNNHLRLDRPAGQPIFDVLLHSLLQATGGRNATGIGDRDRSVSIDGLLRQIDIIAGSAAGIRRNEQPPGLSFEDGNLDDVAITKRNFRCPAATTAKPFEGGRLRSGKIWQDVLAEINQGVVDTDATLLRCDFHCRISINVLVIGTGSWQGRAACQYTR
ncbi:hypothetical protein RHECNPAF_4300102 [Rhizobium etli CNPAF512]|nr:hypothetical protein RHECNPAF_4300102 [Rhizobium etli CNPAF512]